MVIKMGFIKELEVTFALYPMLQCHDPSTSMGVGYSAQPSPSPSPSPSPWAPDPP